MKEYYYRKMDEDFEILQRARKESLSLLDELWEMIDEYSSLGYSKALQDAEEFAEATEEEIDTETDLDNFQWIDEDIKIVKRQLDESI